MPSIEELVTDTSQHVRAALGTQISGLAPILGKEKLVVEYLLQQRVSLLTWYQNDSTFTSDVLNDA